MGNLDCAKLIGEYATEENLVARKTDFGGVTQYSFHKVKWNLFGYKIGHKKPILKLSLPKNSYDRLSIDEIDPYYPATSLVERLRKGYNGKILIKNSVGNEKTIKPGFII